MSVRFDVEVSLALGADTTADPSTWSWTDITSYCMVREGGVTIHRGRSDWQSIAQPSWCTVLVNNNDGRFSRLNPLGAYASQLTKNTPLRVRARESGGTYSTRFVGFVSEWPPRWDPSESHFWVPLRADGVLRRLGRRSALAKSYLRGALGSQSPIAYWPMEDDAHSTSAASAVPGVPAASVLGTVEFGTVTPPTGAAAGADLSGGGLVVGTISQIAPSDYWNIQFILKVNSSGSTFTPVSWSGTGSISGWSVRISSTDVQLQYTAGGSTSAAATVSVNLFDGEWHGFVVTMQQVGSDVSAALTVDSSSDGANTVSSNTIGTLTEIRAGGIASGELLAGGHMFVYNSDSVIGSFATAFETAGAGSFASGRVTSVASDESITVDVDTVPGESQQVGPQGVKTALELLRECEAADAGLLVERKTGELGFDSHLIRENLSVALALDYSLGHIKSPFDPTDDDERIRNDVTVFRTDGSSARVVQTEGPMGTDPETGAGTYSEALTLNLYEDRQLPHAAGWLVNLGTVNEYHYPGVLLKLHSSSDLVASWKACDIGSRVTITNLPSEFSAETADQIVEGYTERVNNYEWDVGLNLAPYKPYKVFVLAEDSADAGAFVGRLAGDYDAAIRVAVDDDDTSIAFDPNAYRWTTEADDFDPDLKVDIGGEVVEVSSIATTAATFVAAGAAAHADNAAVSPALYAGETADDLICVVGRIRGTAGSLATPAGYTLLKQVGNLYLWAKVHDGSEAAPTLTPSDGSAGDTVTGITFGLRGTPVTLTDLSDIVVQPSPSQSNASAQNIAYGGVYPRFQEGCVVLLVAGKSDDWTSVAVPTGLTEITEASTTTGSDQGIYAAYQIQTTPAVFPDGSLAVTGGASAVSESMVVCLAAGYQTLTVSSRAVNGLTMSHAAGTRIEVEDAYVLGL